MRKVLFSVYFGLSVLALSAGDRVHTVKPGESLYSIARQYNVSVSELKNLNASLLSNTNIKPGQKLVVSGEVKKATALPPATPATVPAKVHVVNRGETFYAICRKYGVSAAEVKQWNQLTDLNVRVGQRLVVSKANSMALYKPVSVPSTPDTPYREEDVRPRFTMEGAELAMNTPESTDVPKAQPVTEPVKPVVTTTSLRTSSNNAAEYPSIFGQYSAYGYKIRKNKGAANYLEDAASGNQNLAFYSNAEAGSVIRVTNLMNHKTIYVKVVGKVPPVDAANEVTIKLSNKAAKDLGAIDEKFLVEVASYASN